LGALMSQSIQKKMRMLHYSDHDDRVTAQFNREVRAGLHTPRPSRIDFHGMCCGWAAEIHSRGGPSCEATNVPST
jgi:hypothetical protein